MRKTADQEGKDVSRFGPDGEKITQSKEALHQAERVAVLTAAGVSAQSGVPTFEGPMARPKSPT